MTIYYYRIVSVIFTNLHASPISRNDFYICIIYTYAHSDASPFPVLTATSSFPIAVSMYALYTNPDSPKSMKITHNHTSIIIIP